MTKLAGRHASAWAVLAALIVNLIWPTTLVVASAADPATALFFAPICSTSAAANTDGAPAKAPGQTVHCPLCVIAGSQLVGPVTPILAVAAPLSAGAVPVALEPQDSPAGVLDTPQQARAPPIPA